MEKKHFIWIIAILTVINLSALGTIFYHIKFQENPEEKELSMPDREIGPPDVRPGQFFRDELNLSVEQRQQFRDLRRNFHVQANELTFEMQIKRNEMITELAKDDPDVAKLKNIARDIGDMHTTLKELTMEYYLGMKEVCTPEQEAKLYKIFEVLINRDGGRPMPGRGRGKGPNPY